MMLNRLILCNEYESEHDTQSTSLLSLSVAFEFQNWLQPNKSIIIRRFHLAERPNMKNQLTTVFINFAIH